MKCSNQKSCGCTSPTVMGSMVRRKFEKQLNREGVSVANCTVRGIMKSEGLSGARRGHQFKITTTSNEHQHRPSDLVDRVFVAPAPNWLWVADLTYVKTHSGWVYVAFIIDVFSRFIVASVGSKGDSYDNVLAESFNGLYKTELIHRQGPWRNIEHVQWATLNDVDWFNNRRIHESLDYLPQVEFEAHYHHSNESESLAVLEMI
jgi:putative transposase